MAGVARIADSVIEAPCADKKRLLWNRDSDEN
jgi:hypothetical protein